MKRYDPCECATCRSTFIPRTETSVFCSSKCYGKSLEVEKRVENADKWFWPRVSVAGEDDCWLWLGATNDNGYGRVRRYHGRNEYAHRISFFLKHGRLPNGVTRHSCDVRLCCNPAHLLEGTIGENISDAWERDRMRHGSRHPSAKFTEDDVQTIRASTLPHTVIANKYGVSDSTIVRLRARKTWRRVGN